MYSHNRISPAWSPRNGYAKVNVSSTVSPSSASTWARTSMLSVNSGRSFFCAQKKQIIPGHIQHRIPGSGDINPSGLSVDSDWIMRHSTNIEPHTPVTNPHKKARHRAYKQKEHPHTCFVFFYCQPKKGNKGSQASRKYKAALPSRGSLDRIPAINKFEIGAVYLDHCQPVLRLGTCPIQLAQLPL